MILPNYLMITFAIIGILFVTSIICIFIISIIRFIINKINFKRYRKDLIESGFFQDLYKPIDNEEKEDLKNTGSGGKTVTFNLKTRQKTVKNNKRKDK